MIGLKEVLLNTAIRPVSMQLLLPYLAVALCLMVTVLYHARLKTRFGDERGIWLYFAGFFTFLALVPLLIILLMEKTPLQALAELGIRPGNVRIGLSAVFLFAPVSVLIGHFVSRTDEMIAWYPFSKKVCRRPGTFLLYELGYLSLYYTAWEFLYRGMLFFPLLRELGFLPALAVSTSLTTLHHIGHPRSEIVGTVLGGVIFGTVALLSGSILYPILIHAMFGVVNDTFIYLRHHRIAKT